LWTTLGHISFLRQLEIVEKLGESLYRHLKQMNSSEKGNAIISLLNSDQIRSSGHI
jgi:hypothetical protein